MGNEINTSYSFFSISKNYTIAVGEFGNVYYYDGNTWIRLERFYRPEGGLSIHDGWRDGRELFLLANITDRWPKTTVVFKVK